MSDHLVKPIVSGTLSLRPGVMAVAIAIVVHHTNSARRDTLARNGPSQKHSYNKNTVNAVVDTCYMLVAVSLRCYSAVYLSVLAVKRL